MRKMPHLVALCAASAVLLSAQNVTFQPYIQPGDFSAFGASDGIVVAWQTDETTPNPSSYLVNYGTTTSYGHSVVPSGRIIDNYLSADPSLPKGGNPYGAHVAYTAVLSGLSFDTSYDYEVTGPGMPAGGFSASFHTRKQSGPFSFAVEGDEGFFPVISGTQAVDYEARIIHEIYDAANLQLAGQPPLPGVDFVINTGDNVYNQGAQDNYRDYWFPVWNWNVDSNDSGAPLARSLPVYIVVGNHDTGGNGDFVNLLSSGTSVPAYTGGLGGGDALDYFNDFYYPLNGPAGFDSQWIWNANSATQNGWYLSYNGTNYNSPAAMQALRNSTAVDSGGGVVSQMDHMGNYSFDYGNAHFLFLDADPHLFNALVDYSATNSAPPAAFPDYPSALRSWVINDLDSTRQLWKVVVFHQPTFSSGNATLRNFQLRSIVKNLEDHGVSMVFNGHEHNYQRTWPLRASDHVAAAPNKSYGTPAVSADQTFDGVSNVIPDGVIYLVEGAGGDRDFDGNYTNPRGSGTGLDQDDSATGTFNLAPGLSPLQGPGSWLDTDLTNDEMVPFFPTAGTGPKITMKFKAKVFSFADVVMNGNSLTFYQISEPLTNSSSATAANPAPYGTDFYGHPMNDPIPDTVVDTTNQAAIVTSAGTGAPALMDKFTVTKPDLSGSILVKLQSPGGVPAGHALTYNLHLENDSNIPLNGAQVRLTLPSFVTLTDPTSNSLTVQGNDVVLTIGRFAPGAKSMLKIDTQVASGVAKGTTFNATASLVSSTALPVVAQPQQTTVLSDPGKKQ